MWHVRHDESRFSVAPNIDAEAPHHFNRHVDVGFRNERSFHADRDSTTRQGRNHQEGAQKLAADIPFDSDRPAGKAIALDPDGWAPIRAVTIGLNPELS